MVAARSINNTMDSFAYDGSRAPMVVTIKLFAIRMATSTFCRRPDLTSPIAIFIHGRSEDPFQICMLSRSFGKRSYSQIKSAAQSANAHPACIL